MAIRPTDVQNFLNTHPVASQAKCSFGEGFFSALVIKFSTWISRKGSEGVVDALFQKLQNNELDAATLRWFSQEQVTKLCDRVSTQSTSQTASVLTVFERTIGLTKGDTQSELVSRYNKLSGAGSRLESPEGKASVEPPAMLIQSLIREGKIPNNKAYTDQAVVDALTATPPHQREEILLLANEFNKSFKTDSAFMISDTIYAMHTIGMKDAEQAEGAKFREPKVKSLDMERIKFAVSHAKSLVKDIGNGPFRDLVLQEISKTPKNEVNEVEKCTRLLCDKFNDADVWLYRAKIIEVVSQIKKGGREQVITDLLEKVKGNNFESLKEFFTLLHKKKHVADDPNILKVKIYL